MCRGTVGAELAQRTCRCCRVRRVRTRVRLLLGVAAFRDVPEANAGLQSDIAEARKDLARRGVVDVVASD